MGHFIQPMTRVVLSIFWKVLCKLIVSPRLKITLQRLWLSMQQLMAVRNFKTGKDLVEGYRELIDTKGRGYVSVRVVFDNYTKGFSLKESTRQRRRGKLKSIQSYTVEDSTQIRDSACFLCFTSDMPSRITPR